MVNEVPIDRRTLLSADQREQAEFHTFPEAIVGAAVRTPDQPPADKMLDGRYLASMNLDFHPIVGRAPKLVSEIRRRLRYGDVELQPRSVLFDNLPHGFDGLLYMRHGKARALIEDGGVRTELWRFRTGCWLGLPNLWLLANRQHIPEAHLAAIPRVWLELMERPEALESNFVFDRLPLADCLELMKISPVFRRWAENAVLVELLHARELIAAIASNPVLGSLREEDRAYLLQLAVLRRNTPTLDDANKAKPYLDGGEDARHRVALMVRGSAHYFSLNAEGQPGAYVGEARCPELVGLGGLVHPAEIARVLGTPAPLSETEAEALRNQALPPHEVGAYLSDDTWIIEWNRRTLRWFLADRIDSWMPAARYLAPGTARGTQLPATLTLLCGARSGLGLSTLALGTAGALARCAYDESWPLPEREVWLVLVARSASEVPEGDWLWAMRKQPGLDHPEIFPGVPSKTLSLERADTPGVSGVSAAGAQSGVARAPARLRIVWLEALNHAAVVTNALRSRPASSDVLVLMDNAWHDNKRNMIEHLIRWETPVIWLHDDPDDERRLLEHMLREHTREPEKQYDPGLAGLPPVLPTNLIRVDRVNASYIEGASRASEAPREVDAIVQQRRRYPWRHVARMLEDNEGAELVKQLKLDEVLDRHEDLSLGRAFWRMKRILRKRTVGLALGGGGVYGCAHIALLEELHRHNVPVDYLSGSSFGAVVGGLYAGAGFDGLRRYLAVNPAPPAELKTGIRASIWGAQHSQTWWALMGTMVYDSVIAGNHVNELIASSTKRPGAGWVACSEIPFHGVGTDIQSRSIAVPRTGTIGWATRVAACLPPAYPAIIQGPHLYVDGAVLANVPANELRWTGADFIVAANVVPPVGAVEQATELKAGVAVVLTEPPRRVHRQATRLLRAIKGADMPPLQRISSRIGDTISSAWLALWKIGVDQGLSHSDYVLDMWTLDVGMGSTWWSERIRAETAARLQEEQVGLAIRSLWANGNGTHTVPYVLVKQQR